ncbi:MAG: DinB family protein [Bdellovibrionales bacterium]|nr:DinB family protein [Bdellovibrionales bacterium]
MSVIVNASNTLYQLSGQWEKIWQECNDLNEDLITKKLDEDTWSILEIIEHCVLAEKVIYTSFIKTQSSASPSLLDKLKPFVIKFALSLPLKVKIPTELVKPTGNETLASLKQQVSNNLAAWNDFLNSIDPEQAENLSFKHPYFGTLSLSGTLSFILNHLGKHYRQILDRKKLI